MLTVVGMGPAGLQWLIPAAREAIAAAEALVGGSRHLQQFPDFAGERFALGADMPALLAWIEAHTGRRVVVLASGDPLFYGIGTRLIAHFGRERVQVIPGISAVQYLCARAGIDMNDMWLTSSHTGGELRCSGRPPESRHGDRLPLRTAGDSRPADGPRQRPSLDGDRRESGDGKRADPLAAGQRRGGRI